MHDPLGDISGAPGADIFGGADWPVAPDDQLRPDLTGPWPMRAELLSPSQITAVRDHCRATAAVFGEILNVPTETVVAWERGELYPDGAAQLLLTVLYKKGLAAYLRFLSPNGLEDDNRF